MNYISWIHLLFLLSMLHCPTALGHFFDFPIHVRVRLLSFSPHPPPSFHFFLIQPVLWSANYEAIYLFSFFLSSFFFLFHCFLAWFRNNWAHKLNLVPRSVLSCCMSHLLGLPLLQFPSPHLWYTLPVPLFDLHGGLYHFLLGGGCPERVQCGIGLLVFHCVMSGQRLRATISILSSPCKDWMKNPFQGSKVIKTLTLSLFPLPPTK